MPAIFLIQYSVSLRSTSQYGSKNGRKLPVHVFFKYAAQFFVLFKVCCTQVSGPVQTTCSYTLSSIHTRNFHTLLCVHNPTKDSVICIVTSVPSPHQRCPGNARGAPVHSSSRADRPHLRLVSLPALKQCAHGGKRRSLSMRQNTHTLTHSHTHTLTHSHTHTLTHTLTHSHISI